MSANTNEKNENITVNTTGTEEKKGNVTVFVPEKKSTVVTGGYNNSWTYNNDYPSLKKKHSFDKVLTEEFRNILMADQKTLKSILISALSEHGYEIIYSNAADGYIYAKGDIPIMLVAHMDTVHIKDVKEIYVSDYGNIISPQGIGGDDRCGIYMITQLLHKKPYVLFTENEEVGCLGAKQFAKDYADPNTTLPKANVKYIIELDRKGSNDMVFYNCDNTEFKNYIGSFGWDEKWGSNSDITVIAPIIGAAAVNLSCGYYKPHTTSEVINIDDMTTNLVRTARMINKAKSEDVLYFKYVHKKVTYPSYYGYCQNYNRKDISSPQKPSVTPAAGTPKEPQTEVTAANTETKDYKVDDDITEYVSSFKKCDDKPKETTPPQKSFKQVLSEFMNETVGSKIKI